MQRLQKPLFLIPFCQIERTILSLKRFQFLHGRVKRHCRKENKPVKCHLSNRLSQPMNRLIIRRSVCEVVFTARSQKKIPNAQTHTCQVATNFNLWRRLNFSSIQQLAIENTITTLCIHRSTLNKVNKLAKARNMYRSELIPTINTQKKNRNTHIIIPGHVTSLSLLHVYIFTIEPDIRHILPKIKMLH